MRLIRAEFNGEYSEQMMGRKNEYTHLFTQIIDSHLGLLRLSHRLSREGRDMRGGSRAGVDSGTG